MMCIEEDIKEKSSSKVKENRITGTNFDMVFYADDTIVFSAKKTAIEELLTDIKHTSDSTREDAST